jgi:hypothetical protein
MVDMWLVHDDQANCQNKDTLALGSASPVNYRNAH